MSHKDKEQVIRYVNEGQETEFVDFKRQFYTKEKRSDLVKDIVAFANGSAIGDKYIVFGVDDQTKAVVGISEVIESSQIENILAEKIEPRITVVVGTVELDTKLLMYVKIPSINENPPYMIRNDGANGQHQGDIFVRVGTCNRRAMRADLDDMYKRNQKMEIRHYDKFGVIRPVRKDNGPLGDPTYGRIDIEVINPTLRPILISGGEITISNEYNSITRPVPYINFGELISEKPFMIPANWRNVVSVYFDFLSADCISLRFEDDGKMQYKTYASIRLYDTDGEIYETVNEDIFLLAKGDILHKIDRLYELFRGGLKKNKKKMLGAIQRGDNTELEKIIRMLPCDLSFVQPDYIRNHMEYPEYDVLYELITAAYATQNEKALNVLLNCGLSQAFIESVVRG